MADGNDGARREGALAEVLAVLTGDRKLTEFWRVAVRPYDPPARIFNRVEVSDRGVATFDVIEGLDPLPRVALQRWSHAAPADALAALVEASLVPEAWLDPERGPRWQIIQRIDRPSPRGDVTIRSSAPAGAFVVSTVADPTRDRYTVTLTGGGVERIATVDPLDARAVESALMTIASDWPHPASIADLVAVASLGADALARAEAIVAETWRARIVWRVMGAEEIARHHDETNQGLELTPVRAFSHEMVRAANPRRYGGVQAWPEECPWHPTDEGSPTGEAWPALRALAALGLHLVAVDAGRVTLAVEAL